MSQKRSIHTEWHYTRVLMLPSGDVIRLRGLYDIFSLLVYIRNINGLYTLLEVPMYSTNEQTNSR